MGIGFEELDYRETRLGALSLRRRLDPVAGIDVFEIKLDDDFLMSSLFTAGETELARLGLAAVDGRELDVLVGGLGLGYTAAAVLDDARCHTLTVVEALPEIIEWHRRGLVPLGTKLAGDSRCRLVRGDFFAMMRAAGEEPAPADPGQRFDVVLLDIDHSPRHVLNPRHAAFYRSQGLHGLAERLKPHGAFAMWSNDPPEEDFRRTLAGVFAEVNTRQVSFRNPYQKRDAACTVYVARLAAGQEPL